MSIENDNLQVITFGCRLNFSETEVIEQQLKTQNTNGYALFNTCSVTLEAERKARQAIRKLKTSEGDTLIIERYKPNGLNVNFSLIIIC